MMSLRGYLVGAGLSCMLLVALCERAHGKDVGIVLLHGKNGQPASLYPLADELAAAGYRVAVPEMCWSRRRIYDAAYLACLRDVDAAIARLKSEGAGAIFVGGQSLGANAALAFGASRNGVSGVIAMAPAHDPPQIVMRPSIAESLAQAHELTAAGGTDMPAAFSDVNLGQEFLVRTTPAIYLSFFAPEGPAVIATNAARVRVPLLWIAGRFDPTQLGPQHAFAKAGNPSNRYVVVCADHLATPAASPNAILAWLTELGIR